MTWANSNESWGSNCEAALYMHLPKPSLCVAMRRFFRRQITYFVWGFAAALLVIIAIDVGFGRKERDESTETTNSFSQDR